MHGQQNIKIFNFVFYMYKQKFVTVLIRPVIETGTTKAVNLLTTTAIWMPPWKKSYLKKT